LKEAKIYLLPSLQNAEKAKLQTQHSDTRKKNQFFFGFSLNFS